jgi:5-methyltetrahydropteroyltriglutamate--homocysteine methyltransferase
MNNAAEPSGDSTVTHPAQSFPTTIAGSLPKPSWLAETEKLWPKWQAEGTELLQAKADATLLWIKLQEDAGLDIVGDGEQSRQHFVHGFLEQVEGIDFVNKVKMGIRNNRYDAMVPQVVAPLAPQRAGACVRGAARAGAHEAAS